MKYLRNPVSGEVKITTALAAKSLRRYGWKDTDRAAWVEYQRAIVQAALIKHVPATRQALGQRH